MQIVIDLDEKIYEIIKNPNKFPTMQTANRVCEAVENGIVLPKRHGRLIDEEKISLSGIHFKTEHDHAMMIGRLNSAPTIIEAD